MPCDPFYDPCARGHEWREWSDPKEYGPCVRCGEPVPAEKRVPQCPAWEVLEYVEDRAQLAKDPLERERMRIAAEVMREVMEWPA